VHDRRHDGHAKKRAARTPIRIRSDPIPSTSEEG
jgi:hypothetical protein